MPTLLDLATGERIPLLDAPTIAINPRFSQNGDRVAWETGYIESGGPLVIYEIERRVRTEIPLDQISRGPIWSPDGREIAFSMSAEDSAQTTHIVRIDGEEPPRLVGGRTSFEQFTDDWSRDGSTILLTEWSSDASRNLGSLRRESEVWKPHPVLATPALEVDARLSPDGDWIAYTSNITGEMQIFIRCLEGPPDRRQVSVNGGHNPLWAPDDRAVYFRESFELNNPRGLTRLMRVDLTEIDGRLEPSTPRPLHELNDVITPTGLKLHDLHPDGERLLYVAPPNGAQQPKARNQAYLMTGWLSEIERVLED